MGRKRNIRRDRNFCIQLAIEEMPPSDHGHTFDRMHGRMSVGVIHRHLFYVQRRHFTYNGRGRSRRSQDGAPLDPLAIGQLSQRTVSENVRGTGGSQHSTNSCFLIFQLGLGIIWPTLRISTFSARLGIWPLLPPSFLCYEVFMYQRRFGIFHYNGNTGVYK